MLVLSRKRGEKIHIGDTITVTVVDIDGDRVRLGITAPDHVAVHREEVYLVLQQKATMARQLAQLVEGGD